MRQEDLNDLMRYPWERAAKRTPAALSECPACGERYCGDGIVLCTECQALAKREQPQGGSDA